MTVATYLQGGLICSAGLYDKMYGGPCFLLMVGVIFSCCLLLLILGISMPRASTAGMLAVQAHCIAIDTVKRYLEQLELAITDDITLLSPIKRRILCLHMVSQKKNLLFGFFHQYLDVF